MNKLDGINVFLIRQRSKLFFVNNGVKLISEIVIIVAVIVIKNTFIFIFVFIIFGLLYSSFNLIDFITIIGFILEILNIRKILVFAEFRSYQQCWIHWYQSCSLHFLRHRSYFLSLLLWDSWNMVRLLQCYDTVCEHSISSIL